MQFSSTSRIEHRSLLLNIVVSAATGEWGPRPLFCSFSVWFVLLCSRPDEKSSLPTYVPRPFHALVLSLWRRDIFVLRRRPALPRLA
ncbi:hypothetical protein L211DRAFT_443428 [Terfezia boudieri ATCC MYA-4762]|uniref:Uncharacterized protein n=1 Tax=Terfezia boudieri ATCC MYA-4762 TaxID=1051890 RepID=A0A3N4LL06_9PEZI|nr:hypothetical protein L211DRAFT_443428 [Terfezia boudieri ATCC MYA-4762]